MKYIYSKIIITLTCFMILLVLVVVTFNIYGSSLIVSANTDIDVDTINYRLDSLDLEDIDNIMIVAHPDDDMIWGGAELIKEDYLVVCITCGVDSERIEEFKSVMNEVNDKYLMLGYPDLTDGEKNDWVESNAYDFILEDIKEILSYKDWKKIVTHNPDGEYGHIHHKYTSSIVTELVDTNKLYYFEHYYTEEDIEDIKDNLTEIDSYLLEEKNRILELYVSQERVVEVYSHMLVYEELISYNNWS